MTSMHYSLEMYHIMGSLILSRSFNVEEWDSGEGEGENPVANTSHGSGMDVDSPEGNEHVDELHHAETEEEDEGDEEKEEDSSNVAMVPMADLLNARYGSENVCGSIFYVSAAFLYFSQAKLFYEKHQLKMVSIKPIKVGEQIVIRLSLDILLRN